MERRYLLGIRHGGYFDRVGHGKIIIASRGGLDRHILEVSQGYMPMMWELFGEEFDIRKDGTVHAPDRPGLGFTPRKGAMERFKFVPGPESVW